MVDYNTNKFLQKFFNRKIFSIGFSWHFLKYFSAQNNSSLQYVAQDDTSIRIMSFYNIVWYEPQVLPAAPVSCAGEMFH